MGKSGYKKFKKQEKAKVKLKGNKTLLPKGQNVTDTTFKVKKIVVKEQLKEHGEHELLTRKHLSVKELIARLSHHNVGMRQDALSGLKELVCAHGSDIVQANLSPLLQAAMTLTVDREPDVRSGTLKLLSAIFDKVTEEELSPLFPVVVCHLTCAMTHIEPNIRADSLKLLDAMLAALPALTAAHTPTLLPHFLDLISQQSNSRSGQGRTLSLHLDGHVTSERWRARVIGRLNRLFSVILDYNKREQNQSVHSVRWRADQLTYIRLYSPVVTSTNSTEVVGNLQVQEYANMLMPLLLDTFTEAVPKQDQDDPQTVCVVGVDTAALLQIIVEVILHIIDLLKQSSQADSLTLWFVKTWGASVVTRLLKGRFPYSVTAANSRKQQREAEQMLAALHVSRDQESSSSLLNLQLCLLSFLLSQTRDIWTLSIHYIKRSLRGGRKLKPDESAVLSQCLEAMSEQQEPSNTPFLLSVISQCDILNTDKPVTKKTFNVLTNIALQSSHNLHQDKHFLTWLDTLPALLCKPSVALSTVHNIATIATRNLPAFTNSLNGWVEEILCNLATLKVIGDKDKEGSKLIVNLVYWVTDWDHELVLCLKEVIQQGSLGAELTSHLKDVLRFKADYIENTAVKHMLEEILL